MKESVLQLRGVLEQPVPPPGSARDTDVPSRMGGAAGYETRSGNIRGVFLVAWVDFYVRGHV